MKLNVSRGKILEFEANEAPASGIITDSKQTPGPCASVTVETETPIPNKAQLSIPDLPGAGGCGLADPVVSPRGTTSVILSIGYSHVDIPTIGQ